MHPSLRPFLVIAALGLAVGCGGGASKTDTQTGPMATVTVSLDLMTQSGALVLPVYISHLYGSAPGHDLATVTIQNTGSASTTYIATIDLPSYASAPGTKTVTIAAGASQTFSFSPALNLPSLFALTTAVPGQMNVKVMAGTTQVYQNTTPIQISGRDTVFWSDGTKSFVPLVTTMVTPHDKYLAIAGLAHDAGLLFPTGMLPGYQAGSTWPSATIVAGLPAGSYVWEGFKILAGDSPSVTIDSVTNGPTTVAIFDAANYAAWTGGGAATPCASTTAATAGTTLTCPTPAEGVYYIVYWNQNVVLSQSILRSRPMGRWETTYQQARVIFTALRNRGMIYTNLPGTGYFAGSQNVQYPAESLAVNSSNCIDGTLVFASIFEALGMEPIMVVDTAPGHGHAFMGVRCWAGTTSCVIPIETTMVGDATKTFDAAVSEGIAKWTAWGPTGDNTATFIDVGAMRALGILPAPM
jgi:hypothetical protein